MRPGVRIATRVLHVAISRYCSMSYRVNESRKDESGVLMYVNSSVGSAQAGLTYVTLRRIFVLGGAKCVAYRSRGSRRWPP